MIPGSGPKKVQQGKIAFFVKPPKPAQRTDTTRLKTGHHAKDNAAKLQPGCFSRKVSTKRLKDMVYVEQHRSVLFLLLKSEYTDALSLQMDLFLRTAELLTVER